MKSVTLSYGAVSRKVDTNSPDVCGLLNEYKQIYNIPGDIDIRVNGDPATKDTTIRTGDKVEFYKEAGRKG